MEDYGKIESLLDDVTDERVRRAFSKVDRARFVPESLQGQAWADHPLPIEDKATISQPSLVAKMTEWLDVRPGDRVLEIGTGSGYQTAILAELASEVVSIEYSPVLTRLAQNRLDDLGYTNTTLRNGDGAKGCPERAPFDRILATVAFPGKPKTLLEQLSSESGIALIPVGPPDQTQYLMRYRREGDQVTEERSLPVRFLSLL
ncbi:MAG TPA: protein-L-isoaspartate(D-aspartate) O-methyltransferase [Opitutales bacterium]|nr:protein-L-isoaspartate(D-aspartate) O-methyltransferase [Opitutales bacterium]